MSRRLSTSKRIAPRVHERFAPNRLHQRLVEGPDAARTSRARQNHPEETAARSRSGIEDRQPAGIRGTGRKIASAVAVSFTGLAILSFALGILAPVVRFDIPFLPEIWTLGRSLLPEALLPLVPLWSAVLAWGVWIFVASRDREPAQEASRVEAPTSKELATPKASSARRRMRQRMVRELRPYVPSIVLLYLVSLAAVPLALITPLPIQLIVDSVVDSRPLPGYVAWLAPSLAAASKDTILMIALGILLGGTLLTHLQHLARSWLTTRVGNRMDLDMRVRLFRQLQRLSTAYHDEKGTTDSTYRIQHDATALRSLAMDGLVPLVTALITLGGMIGITATLDRDLGLIALSVAPFMFLFTFTYRPRIRAGWRIVKRSESAAMSAAQESLSASRVVKAYGQEARTREQFHSRYKKTARAALKLTVDEGIYSLIVGVVTALGLAAVLFIGVQHVQAGTLSTGALYTVFFYMTQLYSPLKDVGKKVLDIQKSMAGIERFLEIVEEKSDVPEKPDARPLARALGLIAFREVSFGYEPGRLVLRDVSFELPRGTCLGIVGPTGSGKTTLANLLVRFFDPTEGAITLDGTDLRDYKVADLRNQFAVVLQDTLLFSTTIAENIRFARPNATDRSIEAAARLADAHDFILSLPDGYDTQVGERGMKLSGGERQRISLARAFLKNAPILILDEPTSSLDLRTEGTVVGAIHRLMKDRTTLMIAHRPSTLRACDAILILEPDGQGRLTDEVGVSLQRMAADGIGGPVGNPVDEGAD